MSIIGGISQGGAGYQIQNSLRLRPTSALRNNSYGTWSDDKEIAFSVWVKRPSEGATFSPIFGTNTTTNAFVMFGFQVDQLIIRVRNSSSVDLVNLRSTAVFRDPSAWYHIFFMYDSQNPVSSERARMYVNGERITQFDSAVYPSLNLAFTGTFLSDMFIGRGNTSSIQNNFFNGYLSELWIVDNRNLLPSHFGERDGNGVWVPKQYNGDGGANTTYLPFSDGTSTTTLGFDASGRSNNFLTSNISLTPGSNYDWMRDTPTNNFSTLNPLGSQATFIPTNGNLDYAKSGAVQNNHISPATIRIKEGSGNFYWEVTPSLVGGGDNNTNFGIRVANDSTVLDSLNTVNGYGYTKTGSKISTSSTSNYGASFTDNDVIGVAYSAINGTIEFFKNGVSQGIAFTGITGDYVPYVGFNTGITSFAISGSINFGQRPFSYTPPTGFKTLSTSNLSAALIPYPKRHLDIKLRVGTGTDTTVSDIPFSPDFIWIKNRGAEGSHHLYDRFRGEWNSLFTNGATPAVLRFNTLTSIDSNGYSLGTGVGGNTNTLSNTYVDYVWKGNEGLVANTNGTISSVVSANPLAGFSVVAYTGNSVNSTVGHGLRTAPDLVIVKRYTGTDANWFVYHSGVPATQYLLLNTTNAAQTNATVWNNTPPDSLVFSLGTQQQVNLSGESHIAYCFAEIPGYSKIGKYIGNASANGTFINCGFKPKFVIVKSITSATAWYMYDSSVSTYNLNGEFLVANDSTAAAAGAIDFLSNGFKLRRASGDNAAQTYVYIAFAENPFGGVNVAPITAR